MSVSRVYGPEALESCRHLVVEGAVGFDPDGLSCEDNYVFMDNVGNVALFEKMRDGVYSGHYFFKIGGKKGIKTARECLKLIFEGPAKAVIGLTPTANKAALWFTSQLGFRNYGTVHTLAGEMRLSILMKEEL